MYFNGFFYLYCFDSFCKHRKKKRDNKSFLCLFFFEIERDEFKNLLLGAKILNTKVLLVSPQPHMDLQKKFGLPTEIFVFYEFSVSLGNNNIVIDCFPLKFLKVT